MILIFTSFSLIAQNDRKNADKLFGNKKYCESIYYYNQYLNYNSSYEVYFKRGVANYYCRNLDKAIEDIENSILLGNYDGEANLYLAKCYQAKQEFDKAINYYKLYLNDIYKNDSKKEEILLQIKYCTNGVYFKYKPCDHFIENWGDNINSRFDDIWALQSNQVFNKFYFSSNRSGFSEKSDNYTTYSVDFNNGKWENNQNLIEDKLSQNITLLEFDNQNDALFFYGYNLKKGTIFSVPFVNSEFNFDLKKRYESTILAEIGYSDICRVNDSTFVFSAPLEDSYGGYDIYLTGIRKGSWFKPINLGPEINTPFNEVSPYLTSDGQILFFSSDNEKSIGGLDIFYSSFNLSKMMWNDKINIGLPANSSGNESGFRLLNSNLAAVFNSDRMDMGNGENDIYWLYFKNKIPVNTGVNSEIPFITNHELSQADYLTDRNNILSDKQIEDPDKLFTKKDSIAQNQIFDKLSFKELIIPNIFFSNDEFSDNDSLIIFLDKLAILMNKNPLIEVEIVGNSMNFDNQENEIYTSVKMAQRIADSLELRMIDPQRIIVKGYGNNFPVAKKNVPERSKNIVLKFNNRIDFYIHNTDDNLVKIKRAELFVLNSIFDTRHDIYETIVEGLSYKVKFKDSYFLMTDDLLGRFNDSGIDYDPKDKTYIYTVGIYKTYDDALVLFNQLLSLNYQNSEIIPYINGIVIPDDELIFYAKKYNDIINFMNANKSK